MANAKEEMFVVFSFKKLSNFYIVRLPETKKLCTSPEKKGLSFLFKG